MSCEWMRWWSAALCALAFVAPGALAQGTSFPAKPIRILVPFPPGGGTDVAARALAEHFGKEFGQPAIVENRPGGNSIIATEAVAKAAPDGHTLLLTTDFHAINAAFGVGLPYDSLKDFAFVAQVSTSPLMLVASPGTGAKTIGELVAAAKASPGKLSFASLGTSSPHHLGFEWFKRMAGISLIDVPYKGAGPAIADLLGGQVNLMFIVAANGIRQARAGKMVALAVTGPARAGVAPEVPTFAESGYPEFVLLNWYGILAPAGTPRDVITRMNVAIVAALATPAVVERLAGVGVDPAPGTPEALESWVRMDIERYRRIIAVTGVKPEGR
ncbi:MAG TPA: tripartite tricarboxylate transporter substrate binding protein [Burkholderiales bacterium]|nr:tripartite tricarboxylate transporter substrate binding protein [Burkholderiales bacterium]